MPKKGDNLEAVTALVAVDHHGVDATIGVSTDLVRVIVHRSIEMIEPDSGMAAYGDAVEIMKSDLATHSHGTVLTLVATGEVLMLQKTLKDDGQMRLIEVTR